MGNLGKWILGLIILAIVATIFNLFTPWGSQTHSVNMGKSVQAALDSNGFGWAKTDMSGNVATLSGAAPSEQAKLAAIEIAKNTQCEKCNDREKGKRWHEVNGGALSVEVPAVRPYTLTGVRMDDGSIVLDGYARDQDEIDTILANAERLFPGKVINRTIKIARGAPHPGWQDVAITNLKGLAGLDSGKFSMENENSVLTGRTTSVDIRSGINSAIVGLPTGYNGATNISVPDAMAANTGQIKSETICQELFESLKGDNKINFAYNRAEIRGTPSFTLLGTLASAANQCSSFRINIEGHTDSDGSDAYNLDLSRRRAEAVLAYLVQNGVSADNVSGGGYGESRPIASNDTPAGMAKNRRIEFKVTRSK